MRDLLIGLAIFIILAVSTHDIYWSIKVGGQLYIHEQNPLGRWLMDIDGGSPALFMSLKVWSTLIVVIGVITSYLLWPKGGLLVALGVATFQAGLAAYLNFG